MSQLFCKVGDLAVTVEAELPINLEELLKAEALEDEQKKGTEGLQ